MIMCVNVLCLPDNLKQLINCAKEHGIIFYYALSPGLDMVFSNPKEIALLKKKMEQVTNA